MFQVVAIPDNAVAEARRGLESGDSTVVVVVADSSPGFPCRRCLRDAKIGERLLLFKYSPFDSAGPYAEIGPVLVHIEGCTRAALIPGQLPEVTVNRARCVVRAYDWHGWIHDGVLTDPTHAADVIESFFSNETVSKIHVRNVEYGCFAYEISRI